MCGDGNTPLPREQASVISRRTFLRGAAAALTAVPAAQLLGMRAAAAHPTATPYIRPRSLWAGSTCPVRGPLPVELAGDVRYLLVHHTASPGNSYTSTQVPGLLRGMYWYHTGPEKNWPDIAYNFLVDKYGRIWEGRYGSIQRPVIPSATGGNQGFDQIACFIGNHSTYRPTLAAQDAMVSLLAWLAKRYAVATAPGSTVTFVSRGSNRYPRGTMVTTRTIEGHRRMSLTTCPGDAAYSLVRDSFPASVTSVRRT